MRAAIYARYSDPRQREASIDDQMRVCRDYAEREGMTIAAVYQDNAITGAVRARPGYLTMVDDITAGGFGALIVHDLSRLSRDDYEMKGLLRKLQWSGLRIVGVADGYDSSRAGHKIHAGFKGLMNELFLDDVRAWTLKGMRGKAKDGYNCGGRTYGYRNVPIEDPTGKIDAYGRAAIVAVRYEIDDAQAEIVRRIHAWYAEGHSCKWIASELNRQRIPSSRKSTWADSAIKVVLENEMYEGTLTWNRRSWVMHPDTGKRTYRSNPREEWIVTKKPELRIVSEELIIRVRRRQQLNASTYRDTGQKVPNRKYLFSGLMNCGECGSNFVITAKRRYGCAGYHTRGVAVCGTATTVSRCIVEDRVLSAVKAELLAPENVARFKAEAAELMASHSVASNAEQLRRRLDGAKIEKDNLVKAIKQGIITASTKEALELVESEIDELQRQIESSKQWNVTGILPRAIERYQLAVAQLEEAVAGHVDRAREILQSLLGGAIRIHRKGEYLVAEIPDHLWVILANSLNSGSESKSRFDWSGCGGLQRGEPNSAPALSLCTSSTERQPVFVSLAPSPEDSTPLQYRKTLPVIHSAGRDTPPRRKRLSHAGSRSRPSKS